MSPDELTVEKAVAFLEEKEKVQPFWERIQKRKNISLQKYMDTMYR